MLAEIESLDQREKTITAKAVMSTYLHWFPESQVSQGNLKVKGLTVLDK